MMNLGSIRRDASQLASDLRGLYRLMSAVPQFFRERVTLPRAEEAIKKLFDRREERFLELVRTNIFDRSNSPYLRLLRLAGCEFSDLQIQVRRYGLDNTLKRLAWEGVYFTSDEFKGKKMVVRGRESFWVTPTSFENRQASAGYLTQSSGTTNDPVRTFVSLDLLAMRSTVTVFAFLAHDLLSHVHAMYDAILPGSGGINNLLIYAKMGIFADRWFARKVPVASKADDIYHRVATQLIVLAAQQANRKFPKPEFTDACDTGRILAWLTENQRRRKPCCITTAASNATRIAHAASRAGISLHGMKFIVSGEPLTESKQQVIETAGATAIPRYAYGGSINIGYGCANPIYADEVHVNQHLLSLLPSPRPLNNEAAPLYPLLCTTLHPCFSKAEEVAII